MAVAKSYQAYEIQGEPFEENKKNYVYVLTPKGAKKVRWYSNAEYNKMYPDTPIKDGFNARFAFGFREGGFITLYKGDENVIREWARETYPPKAWYNEIFHFYTPAHLPVENVPDGVTPIVLKWEEVCVDETRMKPYGEVETYVTNLIRPRANVVSTFQGAENEWLQKKVVVRENIARESQYGEKHTHYLIDAEGNTYVWETGAQNFEVGMEINLKMKVKAHKEIKGECCTIVWYCKLWK